MFSTRGKKKKISQNRKTDWTWTKENKKRPELFC